MMPELCYRCGGEGHFASDCKVEHASGGDLRDRGRDRDPRDYERTRGADFPPGGFGKQQLMRTGVGG